MIVTEPDTDLYFSSRGIVKPKIWGCFTRKLDWFRLSVLTVGMLSASYPDYLPVCAVFGVSHFWGDPRRGVRG